VPGTGSSVHASGDKRGDAAVAAVPAPVILPGSEACTPTTARGTGAPLPALGCARDSRYTGAPRALTRTHLSCRYTPHHSHRTTPLAHTCLARLTAHTPPWSPALLSSLCAGAPARARARVAPRAHGCKPAKRAQVRAAKMNSGSDSCKAGQAGLSNLPSHLSTRRCSRQRSPILAIPVLERRRGPGRRGFTCSCPVYPFAVRGTRARLPRPLPGGASTGTPHDTVHNVHTPGATHFLALLVLAAPAVPQVQLSENDRVDPLHQGARSPTPEISGGRGPQGSTAPCARSRWWPELSRSQHSPSWRRSWPGSLPRPGARLTVP
jgi:hypothetical protein